MITFKEFAAKWRDLRRGDDSCEERILFLKNELYSLGKELTEDSYSASDVRQIFQKIEDLLDRSMIDSGGVLG